MSKLAKTMTTRMRVGLLTTCLVLVPSTTAFAQDAEIVAPRTLGGDDDYIFRGDIQRAMPDSAIPEAEGDDTQLLDRMRGMVFVTSAAEIVADGVTNVTGVAAHTGDVLATSEFQMVANRYLGQPVSLRSLKQLNRDVVAFYADHGYPVVDVVTPEQDISSGVVQFIVYRGRLGQVRVEGNEHFSSEHIAGLFRLEPGAELRSDEVADELRWVNNNPFRRVDLVYTPGAEAGETDIVLRTQDRRPFRVYGGYEDTGNDQTGYHRAMVGFNWGNAFGLDHQFNYQYTRGEDADLFSAHSASYVAPLPWRHTLSVFGSVADTMARPGSLPGGAATLDLIGESHQVSLRYGIPLPQLVDGGGQEISFGYDFKRTNNNLEFGGLAVLDTTADTNQFVLGYSLSLPDGHGRTTINSRIAYSPGGWVRNDNDTAYQEFNDYAEAEYTYWRLSVGRVQRLPRDLSLIINATAQVSSTNLMGSEQLAGGGYNSVRGFDYRIANGDEGLLLNAELRSPSIRVVGRDGSAHGNLQFLLFGDYGRLAATEVDPGDTRVVTLSSIGTGVRYSFDPHFSVRLDWGYQLNAPDLPDGVLGFGRGRDHRIHLGMVLGF
jgi:hemolysin activation/secretion protein